MKEMQIGYIISHQNAPFLSFHEIHGSNSLLIFVPSCSLRVNKHGYFNRNLLIKEMAEKNQPASTLYHEMEERKSLAWAALFAAFLIYPSHLYGEEEYIRKCILEAFDLARRKANPRFRLKTPFPFDRTGDPAGLSPAGGL